MAKTVRSQLKSGLRAKKGKVGKRAQYWTRARVLRRLQLPLSDFRKICILKGIYPRAPPKGKDKGKVYYHAKDILYLQHERLIDRMREVKVFLRRRKRLLGRHEDGDAEKLVAPLFKMDHLVRERYPSITDALRDLDDPLTTLNLFNTLRVRVHKSYNEKDAEIVQRLVKEWKEYVVKVFALRKVFVSIKGYYFQAVVKGNNVTWLVPHQTMQNTPKNVDYDVMTTFLTFYQTMLRCVNFKLFKEEQMQYPPTPQSEEELAKAYFSAIPQSTSQPTNKKQSKPDRAKQLAEKTTQSSTKLSKPTASTNSTVSKSAMKSALAASKAAQDDEASDVEEQHEGDLAEFQQLDPSIQLTDPDAESCRKTFEGCVILVSRETAFDPISFVIRCGGGIALYETAITPQQAASPHITHQIVDRPGNTATFVGRSYIQPQWVFDSFNMRARLPIQPYAPGQSLPPHLSPFIDDEKEGYVPDQRNVLRQWVGMNPLKQSSLERIKRTEEEKKRLDENKDEREYQKQLKKEQMEAKAAKAAAKRDAFKAKRAEKAAPQMSMGNDDDEVEIDLDMGVDMGMGDSDAEDEGSDAEIDVQDVSDSDFDENTYMADGDDDDSDGDDDDDEEEEEEARIAAKPAPVARPRDINKSEQEMSKFLMNRKDARLHSRMMFGKGRVSEQAKRLEKKKVAAEQGVENPTLAKRSFNGNRRR